MTTSCILRLLITLSFSASSPSFHFKQRLHIIHLRRRHCFWLLQRWHRHFRGCPAPCMAIQRATRHESQSRQLSQATLDSPTSALSWYTTCDLELSTLGSDDEPNRILPTCEMHPEIVCHWLEKNDTTIMTSRTQDYLDSAGPFWWYQFEPHFQPASSQDTL